MIGWNARVGCEATRTGSIVNADGGIVWMQDSWGVTLRSSNIPQVNS